MKNEKYIRRPVTFKIEMTKGCNLKCKFCPVYAMPELQGKYEYMQPATAAVIMPLIAELNPEGRIELTRKGEPTLNPYIANNVRLMRETMPKVQISLFTNGTMLFKKPEIIDELLDAGVNIFNIDCYNNTYNRFSAIVDKVSPSAEKMDFREFSAYKRHSGGHKLRVINLVPDIADPAELVKVRKIHNAAGNTDREQMKKFGVAWPTSPLKKNCAKPYREMVINYNGEVPICCEDWHDECILGKMPENTAREIWYGDFHLKILRSLWKKDRRGVPCNKCSFHGGYRLGLLHNPMLVRGGLKHG